MNEFAHFVAAQDEVYPQVIHELRHGLKRSHWMWFVFPQLAGLGSSSSAQRYALASLEQADRYYRHSLLGERLRECTGITLTFKSRPCETIFGYPDCLKFQSCMTLFHLAAPAETLFQQALESFYAGELDARTLQLLKIGSKEPRNTTFGAPSVKNESRFPI